MGSGEEEQRRQRQAGQAETKQVAGRQIQAYKQADNTPKKKTTTTQLKVIKPECEQSGGVGVGS